MEDGKWSGEEPRCECMLIRIYLLIDLINFKILFKVSANEAQEAPGIGTGIAIGAVIIVVLLVIIGLVFLHRNKARPVKNTENIQAAETKEDQNAAVMSYSSLENNRHNMDLTNRANLTFNTFHPTRNNNNNNNHNGTVPRLPENIYDQIPNDQFYDAPYEMRSNDEVYEPEPIPSNTITINGISVR